MDKLSQNISCEMFKKCEVFAGEHFPIMPCEWLIISLCQLSFKGFFPQKLCWVHAVSQTQRCPYYNVTTFS